MSVHPRRLVTCGTALALALTVVGGGPAQAGAAALSVRPALAPVVPAPPSEALPVALDVFEPYAPQVSCDPRPKPGVSAFGALMTSWYKTGATGTFRTCAGDTSEHYDSRALDWMNSVSVPRQKAIADSVTAWLTAGGGVMARRFGIMYIIWNKHIWGEYAPSRGWAPYSGVDPHTSHVHFSFTWDGAMKRTSWWTGRATTVADLGPCQVYAGQFAPLYTAARTAACPTKRIAPASAYPVSVVGQSNAQVAVAQRVLGVVADGQFGMGTFAALVSWQTRIRVPVTGVLDKATWARMVPTKPGPAPAPATPPAPPVAAPVVVTPYTAYKPVVLRQGSRGAGVVFLQRALKVTPDGAFGPRTRAALVAFQTQQHLPRTGVTDRTVWNRLETRAYPLIAYRGLTLRLGSHGAAVLVLQRALRLPASGVFGPSTAAVVKAVQSRAKLAPTGVVSGGTWVAIERQMPR